MANICNRCARQIVTAWRTAKGNHYHPHCFTCAICDVVIESEHHHLDNCNLKEIYCTRCYTEYFTPTEEKATTMMPVDFRFEGENNIPHTPPPFSFSEFSTKASHLENKVPHSQEMLMNDNDESLSSMDGDKKNYAYEEPLDFKISTVLKCTKPPAFMTANAKVQNRNIQLIPKNMTFIESTEVSPSKIPKRKGNQTRPSPCLTLSGPTNIQFDKLISNKQSQNQIRAKSFHVPQQIRSNINEYMNSKGIKMTPVCPGQSQQRKRTPLKAVHGPIPLDSKKMSPIGLTSNSKSTNAVSNLSVTKSHSAMNDNATCVKSRSSTKQMKPETKLSNFQMPSFIVPKFSRSATPTSMATNFQQSPSSLPFPYSKPCGPRHPDTISVKRYFLPQEIMDGTAQRITEKSGRSWDMAEKHANSTNESTTSSVYFGNITLPRPIQKQRDENRSMHLDNSRQKGILEGVHVALDCPICLDKLVSLNSQEGGKSKENVVTCCGHIFHKECIHSWLNNADGNGRCPTCSQLCLKESMIPVYIEANIADNFKNADNDELKSLLTTLRSDYKHLREKYQTLLCDHSECETRFAITDSLRSAYEMESRTRAQLQWENKLLHQKLQEMMTMVGIAQGDNFHTESTASFMNS